MLDLPRELLAAIACHGQRTYPEECCGVLLGALDGEVKRVTELLPMANVREDDARARRYLISPEALRDAEAQADARDLDVLGFYHSHPDHPARPSAFDRDHAWPFWSYLIVSIRRGEAVDAGNFRLDGAGNFQVEPTTESLALPSLST